MGRGGAGVAYQPRQTACTKASRGKAFGALEEYIGSQYDWSLGSIHENGGMT